MYTFSRNHPKDPFPINGPYMMGHFVFLAKQVASSQMSSANTLSRPTSCSWYINRRNLAHNMSMYMGAWPIAVIRNAVWGHILADKIASEQGCCRSVHYSVQRTVLAVPIVHKQDLKNIKNVKRCRDGMPKSMQTR